MTTQAITNGGFESGTTGWGPLGYGSISTNPVHSGSYSWFMYEDSTGITQTLSSSVPVSQIASFTFYAYSFSDNFVCVVTYSDSTTSSHTFIVSGNAWVQFNMLPYLTAGKTITSIRFWCNVDNPVYLDDVSLTYTPITTYALDVLSALKALITAKYAVTDVIDSTGSLTTPTLAKQVDGLYIQLDEYNPLYPRYQLVLINGGLKSTQIAPYVYKMEQSAMLDLHVRPVRNDPDATIPNQRAIFESMKVEIQNILTANQYNALANGTQDPLLYDSQSGTPITTYYSVIEQKSWSPSKIPHGFGRQKDPLEMLARLSVVVTYYLANGVAVNVGTRLVSVSILSQSLLGLVDGDWEDMDQWVQIKIPKGPVIEQGLIGPHVDGIVRTTDFRSLQNCLMLTQIPENTGHYPINSDNSKTQFSTTIPLSPEFIITLQDTYSVGASPSANFLIFNFYNVRIKQIKMVKADTKGTNPIYFEIHWMADFYYVGIP